MKISTLDERIKRDGTWAYQQTCAAVERSEELSNLLAKLEVAAVDAPNARRRAEGSRAKVDAAVKLLRNARSLLHGADVDAFLALCDLGRGAE